MKSFAEYIAESSADVGRFRSTPVKQGDDSALDITDIHFNKLGVLKTSDENSLDHSLNITSDKVDMTGVKNPVMIRATGTKEALRLAYEFLARRYIQE